MKNYRELKGKKSEILKIINNSKEEKRFFIKTKMSPALFSILLSRTAVEEVILTKSMASHIGSAVLNALKESGIKVVFTTSKRGRPYKYPDSLILKVMKSPSVSEKLKELGLKERTYYYRKKRLKSN